MEICLRKNLLPKCFWEKNIFRKTFSSKFFGKKLFYETFFIQFYEEVALITGQFRLLRGDALILKRKWGAVSPFPFFPIEKKRSFTRKKPKIFFAFGEIRGGQLEGFAVISI